MEQLCDLLFELSNMDRVKIIQHLNKTIDNVTGIAKNLQITTQEASRHITRLTEVGMIAKSSDGKYSITSYGSLVLTQLPGYEFTSANIEYLKDHSLDALPNEFVSRIGELNGCFYIDDVMAVFQNIQEMCDEAEEFIWRITDKRLNIIYPKLQEAADRGVEYLRIEPEVVVESPMISTLPPVNPGQVRCLDSVDIFMAISEKEVGGLAFPRVSGEFDYLGFTSKEPKALKWCQDIFRHYWNRAKTKLLPS